MPEVEMDLKKKDATSLRPKNDDPMAIIVKCDDWEIKRVLVAQGSYEYIIYWNAFERLHLDHTT